MADHHPSASAGETPEFRLPRPQDHDAFGTSRTHADTDRRAGYGHWHSERSRFDARTPRVAERPLIERLSDEIASWFGAEEAEARRVLDAEFRSRQG